MYFGYRRANVLPSHLDLPQYKTSSPNVNPIFEQFNWEIISEFENWEDAYNLEQQLILENWGDPLLINGTYCTKKGIKFAGVEKHTKKSKKKMSIKATGRKQSVETIEKRVSKLRGKPSPIKGKHTHSEESKKKISEFQKNKIQNLTEEEKKERLKQTIHRGPWSEERKKKHSQRLQQYWEERKAREKGEKHD